MHRIQPRFIFGFFLVISIYSVAWSQEPAFRPATVAGSQSILTPVSPSTATTAAQLVFEFSEVVRPGADSRELAVAFHKITYIDAGGHSLGELVFGTAAANNLQQGGWFGNETWSGIGSFQWAGGPAKTASMQLSIPQGAEGLLLKISSIKDNLWMNVKIDGELAARLRVDADWHSGYVRRWVSLYLSRIRILSRSGLKDTTSLIFPRQTESMRLQLLKPDLAT